MAWVVALLRLFSRLTGRELRDASSLGLNNLFFCVVFLLPGGGKRGAFWSTLLFQIVLLVPLLASLSLEAMERLPVERVRLWPMSRGQQLALGWTSLLFTPMFCVLAVVYLGWMGVAAAVLFVGFAVGIHVTVLVAYQVERMWRVAPWLRVPRLPGSLGGVAQVTLGQLVKTLDFWTALLLSGIGTAYRWWAKAPQMEAFPIFAMLAALALSTTAQRMLSLDGGGALERYRMLPVRGWRLLLVQDATYLALAGLLASPLSLRAGLAFSCVALAVGRYPSLLRLKVQQRWRFTAGELWFGVAQVVLGFAAGLVSARLSVWWLTAAAVVWGVSVVAGGRMWRRVGT